MKQPDNRKSDVTIRNGERLPYLEEGKSDPSFLSKAFGNKVIAVCNAVLNCRQWLISENGILFTPGSGIAGGSGTYFTIDVGGIHGDYVMGTPVAGGTSTKIAKWEDARTSLTTETIDAIVFNYTYTDSNHRSSNDGTTTQAEVMHHRYKEGQRIWAQPSAENGVSGADWLETKPVREWARRYNAT